MWTNQRISWSHKNLLKVLIKNLSIKKLEEVF